MQNLMLHFPSAPETADAGGAILSSILSLLAGFIVPIVGAGIGFVLAFVLNIVVRVIGRRSKLTKAMLKRSTSSFTAMLTAWSAWLAVLTGELWQQATTGEEVNIEEAAQQASQMSPLEHILLILAIVATTWFAYTSLFLLEDAARLRREVDGAGSRRFETQAQVLRRLGQVIIVFVGLAFIVFTFPSARQVMAGLLASAGIVSVIAGLAAQSTLGNVFAGLQLAFTDAIRVGDTVVAGPNMSGPNRESGQVEEITLSYVVVRVWDDRRLVIPSSEFTTSTFENWTRRAPKQQGTVELRLDWGAPMAQIRHKVASILAGTDLWDGREWGVHVTDADKDTILVRIILSARNSSELFQLRALVREEMINWVMTEEPWARPSFIIQQRKTVEVDHDRSGEEIARLAAELSGIAADTTVVDAALQAAEETKGKKKEAPEQDAAHAARITASRQKAKKARRRAMAERQRELAEGVKIAGDTSGDPDVLATQVITSQQQKTIRDARREPPRENVRKPETGE